MLANARVAYNHTQLRCRPITHKHFCACLVKWHIVVLLYTCLVEKIVVQNQLTVATWQLSRAHFHILSCSTLAILVVDALLDIAPLQTCNKLHNNTQNTTRILFIWWCIECQCLLLRVNGRRLALNNFVHLVLIGLVFGLA